jgi:hypothetical protein
MLLMEDVTDCELCGGTGTMRWQQPVQGPDGGFALVKLSHPCPCGRSGWWRAPAAEQANVVNSATPPGNVAHANSFHRTDWSRPISTRPTGEEHRPVKHWPPTEAEHEP